MDRNMVGRKKLKVGDVVYFISDQKQYFCKIKEIVKSGNRYSFYGCWIKNINEVHKHFVGCRRGSSCNDFGHMNRQGLYFANRLKNDNVKAINIINKVLSGIK